MFSSLWIPVASFTVFIWRSVIKNNFNEATIKCEASKRFGRKNCWPTSSVLQQAAWDKWLPNLKRALLNRNVLWRFSKYVFHNSDLKKEVVLQAMKKNLELKKISCNTRVGSQGFPKAKSLKDNFAAWQLKCSKTRKTTGLSFWTL